LGYILGGKMKALKGFVIVALIVFGPGLVACGLEPTGTRAPRDADGELVEPDYPDHEDQYGEEPPLPEPEETFEGRSTFPSSSSIHYIIYDAVDGDSLSPENGTLYVRFRGGTNLYTYCDVPVEVVGELLEAGVADYAGSYFHENIANKYDTAVYKSGEYRCV
jgi:hypothetical protein